MVHKAALFRLFFFFFLVSLQPTSVDIERGILSVMSAFVPILLCSLTVMRLDHGLKASLFTAIQTHHNIVKIIKNHIMYSRISEIFSSIVLLFLRPTVDITERHSERFISQS